MTNRFEKVEAASENALWTWLSTHHAQTESVWLVTWKAAHPDKYLSRDAVLDALIAYGWIDGRRMKLDDNRTMQLISPRKEQRWADTYKARAARLESEGRMQDPGRAAIAASRASGKWNDMADVDALKTPSDLQDALEQHQALLWWDKAAPSYRRNILRWIATAKNRKRGSNALHLPSITRLGAKKCQTIKRRECSRTARFFGVL